MTNLNRSLILAKIDNIVFSDGSFVKERASDIVQSGKNIGFSLDITGLELSEGEAVRLEILKQLSTLDGIEKISVVLTSSTKKVKSVKGEKAKIHIENVEKIIIVAAGKGGVGKSTISALLAQKLVSEGKKVGIIDADIYGPSIQSIFGLQGKTELDDNKMIPLENHGVKVNSIGFLTAPGSSISWRGPMASKALYQLLSLTKWGKLDYLIVDMPPGTGDIHLSLLQNYIVSGVIMVTTPQKISKIDVTRAINLYKKFEIPILGVIENMSYLIDPKTSKSINIFFGNSGEEIAHTYKIPLLAKLPINPSLSKSCDLGSDLHKFIPMLDIRIFEDSAF